MCFNYDDFRCNNETTMDYVLYIPWCLLLIILGIIQIISGTFYFITIPIFKLLFTICTGCWSVLIGIGGSMIICICPSGIKKHEILLYCSVSILILNTINLVMLEFGQLKDIFNESYRNMITETIDYDLLSSQYGRMITTVTALVSVLTAFIGAQISFCLLSKYQLIVQKDTRNLRRFNNYNGNNSGSSAGIKNKKKNMQLYVNSDQASDLEYVITKKQTPSSAQQQNEDQTTNIQVYTQSWVFEGGTDDANPDSLSLSSTSSYSNSIEEINKKNTNAQRRTSKLSVAGSDRCMLQLTSFSRAATPSPVPNSGQITPYLVNSQYDGMEPSCSKYTDNYKLDVKVSKPKSKSKSKVIAVTTQQSADSGNNYGALLAELEQSLSEKKMQSLSPDDNSLTISSDKPLSSKSSSKDMEFSKELEAALQLIQELETPSEGPLGGHTNTDELQKSDILRTSSEKTLSAAVSFGELMSPEAAPSNPIIVTIISESPYQEK